MSKKLASGADVIVLDVKCGSGAFMKTEEEARVLAQAMVDIGKGAGRCVAACITDMDQPLGRCVGNALEVRGGHQRAQGRDARRSSGLCLTLGSCILTAGGIAPDNAAARAMLQKAVDDGSALRKLGDLIEGQGGDRHDVADTSRLPAAPVVAEVRSPRAAG